MLACNLVGTTGADTISIDVGAETVVVTINDDVRECDRDDINIDALAGHDTVHIVDDAGDDKVRLLFLSVEVEGEVNINIGNIESSHVRSGGGNDSATLTGTSDAETIYGKSTSVFLQGDGFDQRVSGYYSVLANMAEGSDVAYLVDSIEDDIFIANEASVAMSYAAATVDIIGVKFAYATAGEGGNDQAIFNGSEADDSIYATENFSTISNPASRIRATGFDRVLANPSGGFDSATAVNTPAKDVFYGKDGFANFKFGETAGISLIEFERVSIVGAADPMERDYGFIVGELNDSKLYANSTATVLQGNGFEFYLNDITILDVEITGVRNNAYFVDRFGDSSFSVKRYANDTQFGVRASMLFSRSWRIC